MPGLTKTMWEVATYIQYRHFKNRQPQTVNIQRKPFWLVAVFWYDTKL